MASIFLRSTALGVALLMAPWIGGCRELEVAPKSLLREPHMSATSVVLDLFFIRLPLGDERASDKLFAELDEQHLSPALRGRLVQHGFRVGLASLHAPQAIEQLLSQTSAATLEGEPSTSQEPLSKLEQSPLLGAEPMVRRRHLQLPTARPGEVIASGLYDSLPLLESGDDAQVSGQTYTKAQGVFTLRSYPESDGRVRLKLRPELHHGEPKQEWVERDHHWQLDHRRPRRIFDDLELEATLAPGEMLVLTTRVESTGSAGYYFFTESTSEGTIQKLLVIRLAQTQHHDLVPLEPADEDEEP